MTRTLALCALLLTVALPAAAKQTPTPTPSPAPAKTGPAGENQGAGPAALTFAGLTGSAVQFLFDAERKDKKGTVALDWSTGTTSMRITLSAPLNDDEETTAATLTGLANGAEFRYALSSLSNPGPNPEEQEKIKTLCQGLVTAHNRRTPRRPVTLDDCNRDFVAAEDADKLALFDFYHHLDKPIWLRGLEVGVSQAKYKYLLPVSLESKSASHANFLATARFGRYSVPTGFLIGSVSYTRNYEAAGDPQTICRSLQGVDDATATRCASGIIGEPDLTERALASLEIRKFFSDYKAITPSVSYGRARTNSGDWEGVWSVDFPIYFIQGPGGTLGGVRFGWRSDKKEVTASIFVGAAIALLK